MKKLFLFLGAAVAAASMSAQNTAIESQQILDNVYIGVNGGVGTNLSFNEMFPVNPSAGIRIGKDFTPVFGANVQGTAWFGSTVGAPGVGKSRVTDCAHLYGMSYSPTQRMEPKISHNFVRAIDVTINSTVNLSNLFLGYQGEPRAIEFGTIAGLGYVHGLTPKTCDCGRDAFIGKAGIDVTYNFGANKEHQLYLEPGVAYVLSGHADNFGSNSAVKVDKRSGYFTLALGYNYKFKTSNGTHNFKTARLYDQAEVDRLNATIAELQNRKPQVIEKIKEVPGKTVTIDNLVFVTFAQGKYVLTNEAKAALDNVKSGAHVQIVGTASPEGTAAFNQKLSQNRANVVADYLKARGVVVDEATGKGVQGTTSNRLAIVYVK